MLLNRNSALKILICLVLSGILDSWANPKTQILEKPRLILGEGEQRLIRVPGLLKFSIGNTSIRILPLPSHFGSSSKLKRETLLIKGIRPGTSDLWIWKSDGSTEFRSISVEKRTSASKNLPLEKALSKLDEAEVIYTGQGVVLRGLITSLQEAARISSISRSYPTEVTDETEIEESLLKEGERRLEHWLKSSGYEKSLHFERSGQTLWIRGNLERPKELPSIEKQLRALFPGVQTEIESLPDHSPTVYFRVFLLELKRNQFHSLGLSWPGSIQGNFQVSSGGIQNMIHLDASLQQLEGNGNGRILSNPELVVRVPGEAELFAGGEIPIQTQSRYFSNVSWKNYGLTLKLKVSHAAGTRIRLEIFTEVSHLDPQISQNQVPGIQSNRMKTQVDARLGTPLLLSGLLQEKMREEVKGLPFLRKIPVLGLLFGSEDYLTERSELVAILYPHASPPPAPLHRMNRTLPRGPIPLPRNWLSPEDERDLRDSENYPWNALQ